MIHPTIAKPTHGLSLVLVLTLAGSPNPIPKTVVLDDGLVVVDTLEELDEVLVKFVLFVMVSELVLGSLGVSLVVELATLTVFGLDALLLYVWRELFPLLPFLELSLSSKECTMYDCLDSEFASLAFVSEISRI
jgi:hypothetical protein